MVEGECGDAGDGCVELCGGDGIDLSDAGDDEAGADNVGEVVSVDGDGGEEGICDGHMLYSDGVYIKMCDVNIVTVELDDTDINCACLSSIGDL